MVSVWDVGFHYTYLPAGFIEDQNAMYSENAFVILPLNPTYIHIYTISKSLYRINHTWVHRLTVYATRETQTKSLCYNFNQKWYYILFLNPRLILKPMLPYNVSSI